MAGGDSEDLTCIGRGSRKIGGQKSKGEFNLKWILIPLGEEDEE